LLNRLPFSASPPPTYHHALFGTPTHYDHHPREERVELVDLGLPSRHGNLARKTTSEFPELEARSR
jgi:hypothetical protein